MSNLEDSRVLSAFSAQQNALPYMINVEQRLGQFKGAIAALEAAGIDPAVLAQINTNTADIATNTANIASNSASISALNNVVGINNFYRATVNQTFTGTTWVLLSGFDLSLSISKTNSRILVMYNIAEGYISNGTGFGRLAIREDNGAYRETSTIFGNVNTSSSLCGFTVYDYISAGSHQFRVYGQSSSGSVDFNVNTNGINSGLFLVMQIS